MATYPISDLDLALPEFAANPVAGARARRRRARGRARRRALGAAALVVVGVVLAALALTNDAYVTTPSMYPTIPPGSEIFIRSQPSYHVGQVIEFRGNGLLWVHRLIAIKPNGDFVTKGDNPRSRPDVFVPATRRADVVGAVVLSVPYLGFPELFVHQPGYALGWFRAELGLVGRLVLLGTAALLSVLLVMRRRPLSSGVSPPSSSGVSPPPSSGPSPPSERRPQPVPELVIAPAPVPELDALR